MHRGFLIVFIPAGPYRVCLQSNHPNVQAAAMQCAPAGVANSLDWLRIQYGIAVPHANVKGLGCTPSGADASSFNWASASDVSFDRGSK